MTNNTHFRKEKDVINNLLTDHFASFDHVFLEIKNETEERKLNFSKKNYQGLLQRLYLNIQIKFSALVPQYRNFDSRSDRQIRYENL